MRGHPSPVPARPARPGAASSSPSTAIRLREKQKMRRIYGVLEQQFRRLLRAKRPAARAAPARRCSALLERRLDNVVLPHRLRVASRTEARQLVRHSTCTVNGKRVNIPSYLVKPGDKIEIREESREVSRSSRPRSPPPTSVAHQPRWLEVDHGELRRHVQGHARPRGAERAADPRAATSSSTTRADQLATEPALRERARAGRRHATRRPAVSRAACGDVGTDLAPNPREPKRDEHDA